jgi:hypothetical protein
MRCIARPGEQDRTGMRQRGGNAAEEFLVDALMPRAVHVGLVLVVTGAAIGEHDQFVGFLGIAVKNLGLPVVHPDDGVEVLGHDSAPCDGSTLHFAVAAVCT